MSRQSLIKPLGEILQAADLVSASQIEVALRDQSHYDSLRLGEILAIRGWLKQETADFFAEHWKKLLTSQQKQPLGYYLKSAALLDEKQINMILDEQEQMGLRFGELAVLKGWLKQTTVDFFLEYLASGKKTASPSTEKVLDSLIAEQPILFMSEPQIIIPQNK